VKRRAVIILPAAERDIGEAYAWLAERDEEAAVRWYNRLMGVIFSLDMFPERCPLAPESRKFKNEIRQILHGQKQYKYRILFDIKFDEVRVLHVRHGARLALGETESYEE
jgi:plasmid stabilization system protein ParE